MTSPASWTSSGRSSVESGELELPSFDGLPPGGRLLGPNEVRTLLREPVAQVTPSDFPSEVVRAIGKHNVTNMIQYNMAYPSDCIRFDHFKSCESGMIKGRTFEDKSYLAFVVVRLKGDSAEYGWISVYQKNPGSARDLQNFAIERTFDFLEDVRLRDGPICQESLAAIGEIFEGIHRDLRLVLNFNLEREWVQQEEEKIPIGTEKV